MRDHVLWPLPWPLRVLVGTLIHRNIVATLHGQGTGRFGADEIAAFRREIWAGFADLLLESRTRPASSSISSSDSREKPFWVLGGPEPTDADASLFGFVVSTLLSTAYVPFLSLLSSLRSFPFFPSSLLHPSIHPPTNTSQAALAHKPTSRASRCCWNMRVGSKSDIFPSTRRYQYEEVASRHLTA